MSTLTHESVLIPKIINYETKMQTTPQNKKYTVNKEQTLNHAPILHYLCDELMSVVKQSNVETSQQITSNNTKISM